MRELNFRTMLAISIIMLQVLNASGQNRSVDTVDRNYTCDHLGGGEYFCYYSPFSDGEAALCASDGGGSGGSSFFITSSLMIPSGLLSYSQLVSYNGGNAPSAISSATPPSSMETEQEDGSNEETPKCSCRNECSICHKCLDIPLLRNCEACNGHVFCKCCGKYDCATPNACGECNNPCNYMTVEMSSTATSTYSHANLSSRLSSLISSINGTNLESAFSIVKEISTGVYAPTPIRVSSEEGKTAPLTVTSDDPNYTVVGAVHTHPDGYYAAPSPGDIYALITANAANPSFSGFYALSSSGVYVLVVTDAEKLANFASSYPESSYLDSYTGEFVNNSELYLGQTDARISLSKNCSSNQNEAFTYSIAYVLSKYNTGIDLLVDTGSGFKKITIKEKTGARCSFEIEMCP